MSSNNRSYFSSSVSFSSSSYSTRNGQTTGSRYAEHTTNDPSGTTTFTASQRNGEPVYTERRDYDALGRPIPQGRILGNSGGSSGRRIEDVSDQQRDKDRVYEERIQDEYAKREGGA